MSERLYGNTRLLLAAAQVWVCAAIYSRMVTGGARTYADLVFIQEGSR